MNAKVAEQRRQLERQIEAKVNLKDQLRSQHAHTKGQVIDETCPMCAQALPEESKAAAEQARDKSVKDIAEQHNKELAELKLLRAELAGLPEPEEVPDVSDLLEERSTINAKIKAAGQASGLTDKIAQAEQAVNTADQEYKAAVTILEGVAAYAKAEGELNIEKLDGMFPGLTIDHYIENIGDGKKNPHFEFCMDGKPYRKLSYGEKIKAGLLFVRNMINVSNMHLPVFVDNAESLTSEFEINSQVISCIAKKGKKINFKHIEKTEVTK